LLSFSQTCSWNGCHIFCRDFNCDAFAHGHSQFLCERATTVFANKWFDFILWYRFIVVFLKRDWMILFNKLQAVPLAN